MASQPKKAYNVQLVDTFDNQYTPLVNVNSLYKVEDDKRIRPKIVSTITLNSNLAVSDNTDTAKNLYIPYTTSGNEQFESNSISNSPLQDITIGTLNVIDLLKKVSPIDWSAILESYIIEKNNYFSLLNNNYNSALPQLELRHLRASTLWSKSPNNTGGWPYPITIPDPTDEDKVVIQPRWTGFQIKMRNLSSDSNGLVCPVLSAYTSTLNNVSSKIYDLIFGIKDIHYPDTIPSEVYNNDVRRIKIKFEEITTNANGSINHIANPSGLPRYIEDIAYLSDLAKLYNNVNTKIENISNTTGVYTAGNGIKIQNKQISTRISSWNAHADYGDSHAAGHNAYDGLRLYWSSNGDLAGSVMCDASTIDFYPHDYADRRLAGKLHVISSPPSDISLDDIETSNGIEKYNTNKGLRLRSDIFDIPNSPNTTVRFKTAVNITVSSGNLTVGGNSKVAIKNGGIAADSSITANAFYSLSDKSLKENINSIKDYDNIPEIVEFRWKGNNTKSYGFIAQDLQKLYPELINEDGNNKLSVDYIAALSLTIKKLQNKIDSLEDRIQKLENKANN